MIPNENHYTYQHLVQINSMGLRGPELPQALEAGERRVLALGDSMIYGQGVAGSSTLPHHLQRHLQEKAQEGTHWRVINAGHRAYATNQELALLSELGPTIQPETVILFWYDNDFEEYDIAETCAEIEASGPRTFDVGGVLEGRRLWNWRFKQLVRHSALAMILHDRFRDGLHKGHPADFYENGFELLEARLEEFKAACADLGAKPVLVVIPRSSSILGDGQAAERALQVQAAARRHEISVIDLLPSLKSQYQEVRYLPILPYDGHYQGIANQRMAQEIAESLISE
jgi:hypothetical protein